MQKLMQKKNEKPTDIYINIDNQGNLHLKIYDTYDFNKKADDFLNKAGRNQMEKGSLQPFFQYMI